MHRPENSAYRSVAHPALRAWLMLCLLLCTTWLQAATLIGANSAATGSSGGTSVTITVPAGTLLGHFMLAHVAFQGGTNISIIPPAGWIALPARRDDVGIVMSHIVYYRVATGTELASYTWITTGGSDRMTGGILVYAGVDTSNPFHAQGGLASSTVSTSIVTNSITTSVANTHLVALFVSANGNNAGTTTAPAGMTLRYDRDSGAGPNGVTVAAADTLQVAATTPVTFSRTATMSAAAQGIGVLIALNPAPPPINNFLITPASLSASTCVPLNITIRARDALNNTLTNYTGTVTISTSPARGTWAKVTAAGTLTATPPANSGAATYNFTLADAGVITLSLSNANADNQTVTVVDSSVPSTSRTSAAISFRDNVFVISNDAIQIAGRNQSMSAAYWSKEPLAGTCAIVTSYSGTKSLKAWLTRDALDPGGTAPTITSVTAPAVTASLPNAQPGASNFSLTFTAGVANFTLASSDVGKYILNLLDDTRLSASGMDVIGASGAITTRPFGLAITNISKGATVNPGGANPSDAVFIGAGQTFQATVGGYLWQAADDLNNDGIADAGADITNNGLAPRFAWPTTLTPTLNTPSPGSLGALGGTTAIAQAGYAGGAVTVNNLTYNEVGSIRLVATANVNYLGTAGINLSTTSGVVGRFIPDHFTTGALLNGSLNNGCGSFTYTGQQSGGRGAIRYITAPQFVVTAQSLANTTTVNYTGTFRKLVASGITLTPPTQDSTQNGKDGATKMNLTGNLFAGTLTDNGNGTLTYVLGNDDFAYTRDDNALIAPFTSAIALSITSVMEPVADNVAANDLPKTLTPTGVEIRFGRLNLQNAYGSELLSLPINLTAEYYADLDGAGPGTDLGFLTNTADGCTSVSAVNVTLTPNSPLAAGDTTLTVASPTFVSGSWHAVGAYSQLSATGAGKQGGVDLSINLDTAGLPWLKGDWDGVDQLADSMSFDDSPTARAVFGIYQGPGRRIFLRERFN